MAIQTQSLGILFFLIFALLGARAEPRPNIVFVLCDDLGYGDVHCLNPDNGKIPTPAADKLAEQGMIFTDAHSGSSVCTPTRYGLMTGRYSWRTTLQRGVVKGFAPNMIAEDRPTVADFLQAHGYHTAIIGKWHMNLQYLHPETGEVLKLEDWPDGAPVGAQLLDGPLTRGFDYYHGFHHARHMKVVIEDNTVIAHDDERNMLPRLTREAVEYIDLRASAGKEQPFFLYLPLGSPHTPIVPTSEWQGRSGLGDYGDFVMQTDHALAQVMAALDRNGLAENTLLIYTSDNGCSQAADIEELAAQGHLANAEYRGAKTDLWDGGHRIPFIARWPGAIAEGARSDQLICLTDFYATVADLLEHDAPDGTCEDSVSFLPAFGGKPIATDRDGIIHHSFSGHFGYRENHWKLLLARGSAGRSSPREHEARDAPEAQLYDMETDPAETENLYHSHPKVAQHLLRQLETYVNGGRSTPGPSSSNDLEAIELWKSGRDHDLANFWEIDNQLQWQQNAAASTNLEFNDHVARPTAKTASYRSKLRRFPEKRSLSSLVVTQSSSWLNWTPIDKVAPADLADAPVFLALGPNDYWIFGRKQNERPEDFVATDAVLEGFELPLKTTPFPNQFDAPGGLKPSLGGYHAWQSRDMRHWVHHRPVSDHRARWVSSAEYVDGETYIYYDFPNDQDPHLLIDSDLTDGEPGRDMGMVFKDPSDGSDSGIIRDLEGKFHLIYEDWSPINAREHSWDSPLAGHAVSDNGQGGFEILSPSVDERTVPTGVFDEFSHPHWYRDDPDNFPGKPNAQNWVRAVSRYEVHEPEQDAYGDWASIAVGDQYYLFGDFHPAGTTEQEEMQIAWFTSPALDLPFDFCGSIGSGHPDPDIGFAEGRFYLINQTDQDYVSPGPWVEKVEVRVGIDTTGDGELDVWTNWKAVRESYDYVPGYAKQISRRPASMDLAQMPAGYSFGFELRIEDTTENAAKPVIESVRLRFDEP